MRPRRPGTETFRRPLMLTLLAVAMALTSACGSGTSNLKLRPNDFVMPLVNGADPGQAVGQCLYFSENGPVTRSCPAGVDKFFGKSRIHPMTKPGSYAYGVFTRGRDVNRAAERVVAYELVTYSTRAVSWNKKLKPKFLPRLRALCQNDTARDELIVVRSFEGCAVTLSGARSEAWRWTISDLGREGSVIGKPIRFWSHDPDTERPPSNAECKARRIVQVEVLPVDRACDRYHADLFGDDAPRRRSGADRTAER